MRLRFGFRSRAQSSGCGKNGHSSRKRDDQCEKMGTRCKTDGLPRWLRGGFKPPAWVPSPSLQNLPQNPNTGAFGRQTPGTSWALGGLGGLPAADHKPRKAEKFARTRSAHNPFLQVVERFRSVLFPLQYLDQRIRHDFCCITLKFWICRGLLKAYCLQIEKTKPSYCEHSDTGYFAFSL